MKMKHGDQAVCWFLLFQTLHKMFAFIGTGTDPASPVLPDHNKTKFHFCKKQVIYRNASVII